MKRLLQTTLNARISVKFQKMKDLRIKILALFSFHFINDQTECQTSIPRSTVLKRFALSVKATHIVVC